MAAITFKQGEARAVNFTVSQDGEPKDLSGALLAFNVKRRNSEADLAISKADPDFDKTQGAEGAVSVFLTSSETGHEPGTYVGELTITFPGSPAVIEKSLDLTVIIEEALTFEEVE